MKANEFVKKYGWDLVKRDVACLESGFIAKEDFLEHYGFEILDDLKRLVESRELVESLGGLDGAKQWLSSELSEPYYNFDQERVNELEQAIADMEGCQ